MFRVFVFFFFKQKTAYEMRISDWSSDVCSSDLRAGAVRGRLLGRLYLARQARGGAAWARCGGGRHDRRGHRRGADRRHPCRRRLDRKSVVEGKSVSVSVDLGGRRIIKKTKNTNNK